MYHYVKFDDLDKNKWNGTVHYAPNGNTFGYYWYLKAVLKEWDAIVEDDYESVYPIITTNLTKEEYSLLPELGPYSVNYLNKTRVTSMIEMAMEYTKSAYYPFSSRIANNILKPYSFEEIHRNELKTREEYETLLNKYSKKGKRIIEETDKDNYKIVSGLKPEQIVEQGTHPDHYKNAQMRIMYNAMHRGIGWSSGMEDKRTGKLVSVSFYVVSHNTVHEIFQHHTDYNARIILYDLMIRNQAGKPMSIIAQGDLADLNFSQRIYRSYLVNKKSFLSLRKSLGGKY